MGESNKKYTIYKIYCEFIENSDIYYGCTTRKINLRLNEHKHRYKKYQQNNIPTSKSSIIFSKYGVDNCKIEIVKEFLFISKNEMRNTESFYVRNYECVNNRIENRTAKEYSAKYRIEHKDKIKKNLQEWRKKNNEHCKEYAKYYRLFNRDRINQLKRENKIRNQSV